MHNYTDMNEEARVEADLSAYRAGNFSAGRSSIVRVIWYIVNILFFINPAFPFSGLKAILLRLFGAEIGTGLVVKPSINIKYPWRLTIGDNCWIGERVWIDSLAFVKIGDNVCVSQGAMLLTGNHDYSKRTFDLIVGEIELQNGCWIGARATVCSGVTCASHSVLAVGSVANRNLEAYAVYQGNPAKRVRDRVIQ